jgi:hypothetical protein
MANDFPCLADMIEKRDKWIDDRRRELAQYTDPSEREQLRRLLQKWLRQWNEALGVEPVDPFGETGS